MAHGSRTPYSHVVSRWAQVEARRFRVGQEVLVQGVPTELTSVDVLEGPVEVWAISFKPDLPVEAGATRQLSFRS